MSSLRDQLLKAGLASKKDKRRVEREKKEERKAAQGHRERKSKAERKREAAEARAREEAQRERALARKAAEEERDAVEAVQRVRQIIDGNRLGARGPVPFFHRDVEGQRLLRLHLSEAMAWRLRAGQVGVAALDEPDGSWRYVIVGKRAVDRLRELAPERVVFFVDDTKGISAPDHAFAEPVLEPSLRARRARPEDVARLGGATS